MKWLHHLASTCLVASFATSLIGAVHSPYAWAQLDWNRRLFTDFGVTYRDGYLVASERGYLFLGFPWAELDVYHATCLTLPVPTSTFEPSRMRAGLGIRPAARRSDGHGPIDFDFWNRVLVQRERFAKYGVKIDPFPNDMYWRCGFIAHWQADDPSSPLRACRVIGVNWLWIVAATGVPLVIDLGRRIWSSRRVRQGLCTNCGYDLRASHDRCPECGMLVVQTAG